VTRILRALLCGLAIALVAGATTAVAHAASAPAAGPGAAPVRLVELDGPLDRAAVLYLSREIDAAGGAGDALVLVRLDSDGGPAGELRDALGDVAGSTVPVAVWVGPAGARARGTAGDLAAAADQTGVAPGAALDPAGAADVLRPTLEGFTAWLDGRPGRDGPIQTAGAPVQEQGMSWYLHVLRVLTDPNLLFFLLLLGLAGVGFELLHPGGIVPAAVGAAALLLAAAGLAATPFHATGLALIAVGVGLFVMEVQIGGVGAYAAAGIAALAGGGIVLLGSDDPALAPSVGVIVATAAVVGGAFAVAARVVRRARRRPPPGGGTGLVGQVGRARAAIGPGMGSVLVNGEIWAARAAAGTVIPAGTGVRVVTVQVDDLTLTVEPREG
jgi:membrane-bound serine protease (ClpP class)